MSNWRTTSNLNDIINSLDEDELNELCSSYCNTDDSNTDAINEFYFCQLMNILQCYGSQFMNLIIILIFIYWWNNQTTNNYLMNSNCQSTNAISDLLEDCFECNCCNNKK